MKKFTGTLEKSNDGLGWTVVRVPFDATATWKERNGMKVRGTVTHAGTHAKLSAEFRTSLFPYKGGGQMLLVNKALQKEIKATLGSSVTVAIEPDMEERAEAGVPAELEKLLTRSKQLRALYDEFSPSAKRDIESRIIQPKSEAARTRAAEALAERMMLTIEGERELPPILARVFRSHPGAAEGWKRMTPAQRRGHLMGVFYYQGPEARERRAIKAAEDAAKHHTKDS